MSKWRSVRRLEQRIGPPADFGEIPPDMSADGRLFYCAERAREAARRGSKAGHERWMARWADEFDQIR